MYAGHGAIALIIKSRRPDVPMLPLAAACYGPDFIDITMMMLRPNEATGIYSHSLPSVLVCATVAAGLYAIIARRPGALAVWFAWLVHWPADFFTGLKPVWLNLDHSVGLDLYHLRYADGFMELVVILIGCWIYARTFAADQRQRRIVTAMACALIIAQVAFDFVLTQVDPLPWKPQLAAAAAQPHLVGLSADQQRRSAPS